MLNSLFGLRGYLGLEQRPVWERPAAYEGPLEVQIDSSFEAGTRTAHHTQPAGVLEVEVGDDSMMLGRWTALPAVAHDMLLVLRTLEEEVLVVLRK